ncbi:hypothetical protein AB0M43_11580 [Longispora sp. NPDC051575]|uniref:hypothetical protein n=1 Tax=Longispora sp. NPDC051575 TaxID=3154943 RepID=UPI00343F7C31
MRTRTFVGYAAVASALPYLALKTAWLAGNDVGINDPALLDDPALFAANAVTAAMELVGVLMALAFTHDWGRRIPAWLVAFPLWVGTGLLAPIALAAPLAIATQGLPAEGPLRDWVFVVVYGGFSVQGVLLALAFFLYCRDRWSGLFADRPERPGPTRALQVLLARVAAGLAGVLGAVELYWGLGGGAGLPAGYPTSTFGVNGVLTLAAAAGLLAMVHRRGRFGVALVVTWVGAGAMFGWGLWMFVNLLQGGGIDASKDATGVMDAVDGLKVLAAVLMGTVAAFVLVERQSDAGRFVVADERPVALTR